MFIIAIFVLLLMVSLRGTQISYFQINTFISSLESGFLSCAALSEHSVLDYGLYSVSNVFERCMNSIIKYLSIQYNSKIELSQYITYVNFMGDRGNVTYCASILIWSFRNVKFRRPVMVRMCIYYSVRLFAPYGILAVTDYVKRCILFEGHYVCYRTANVPTYSIRILVINYRIRVPYVVPCYSASARVSSWGAFCNYVKGYLGYIIEAPQVRSVVRYRHGTLVLITYPVNITNTSTGLYVILSG